MKWSVSGQTVRITTPARAAARSSGRRAANVAVALGPQLDAVEPGAAREVELAPQVVPGQQLLLARELHHCGPPLAWDDHASRRVGHGRPYSGKEPPCPARWCWTAPRRCSWSSSRRHPLQPGEARLRSLLSGISHGTELSLYRGTSAFTDRVFDRGLRAFVTPAGGHRVGVPGDARLRDGERGRRGRARTSRRSSVGDLVHTGTPHQEETVLDVAESLAATYPLVVLPTAERIGARPVHLPAGGGAAGRARRGAQARRRGQRARDGCHRADGRSRCASSRASRTCTPSTPTRGAAPSPRSSGPRTCSTRRVDESIGLQVRDRNHGRGVDVAIDVSGSDRGLQGALAAAGLGATVVAAGFYQGGAANLRLGEEFHHNRLSLIASIGGWGTPNRHAPLWDRRRVLDVATAAPLHRPRVRRRPARAAPFPFDSAPEAYAWLDEHPQEAVKVALEYGAPRETEGSGSGSSATACPARRCTPR